MVVVVHKNKVDGCSCFVTNPGGSVDQTMVKIMQEVRGTVNERMQIRVFL